MTLLLTVALTLSLAEAANAQLAPPNEAGVTYGHVHLNVRDIKVQKKLWVEHFGGVVVQKGTLVAVKLPNMLIAFRQAAPTGGSEGTVLDHFGFKVRNLAEMLQGWRAAGYQVQREFTGAEGFPNAYLMGPDDMFSAVPRKRGTIDSADVPGMNLSFATSSTARFGTKGRVVDHIGFEVKNLEAFVKKLEARGVKIDMPYRNVPSIGLNTAYITDPSGVYIELTEGYDKY